MWPPDCHRTGAQGQSKTYFRTLLNGHLNRNIIASQVPGSPLHCVRIAYKWVPENSQRCESPWAGLHCKLWHPKNAKSTVTSLLLCSYLRCQRRGEGWASILSYKLLNMAHKFWGSKTKCQLSCIFSSKYFLKMFVYELQQRLFQTHYETEINKTCRSQTPSLGEKHPPQLSGEALIWHASVFHFPSFTSFNEHTVKMTQAVSVSADTSGCQTHRPVMLPKYMLLLLMMTLK